MAKPTVDTAGIIEVMNRLYQEILAIEEPLGLHFGNGDFRPRIEYFHDAVRALSSGKPAARLSVEMLAYDLSALRYIQSMPLSPIHHTGPHREVITQGAPAHPKADRVTKLRLGDLYQQYGVLFAALFKPEADYNYHERADALNTGVKQLADIAQLVEGKASPRQVQNAIAHLDETTLREALHNKKGELGQTIKKAIKQADSELAQLDKAHLQYGSAQLGMYEDGKDIVKKLAAKGMNLAGQFVQNAIAQAHREMGRG